LSYRANIWVRLFDELVSAYTPVVVVIEIGEVRLLEHWRRLLDRLSKRREVMTRTSAARSANRDSHENDLSAEKVKITTADLYRAGWASTLGSALEYYDFALYSVASALIFAPLFFPAQDPAVSLIGSFGSYFLGFAVRPVGGIFFGILGDRLGRRFVLLATIGLMGAASTLIGVLPTYSSVGYWAPLMLIGLRLLQGFGAGAEQAGAAVLMTEYAPRERRGFFAAIPFLGIQLGTVAASLIYFVLLLQVQDVAQTWWWRVPFLLSVVLIGVAIWIRLKLKESPEFKKLELRQQVDRRPLTHLLKNSKKTVLLGIGLRMGENGGSSLYQALAVSYMVGVVGLTGSVGALSLVFAPALGAIVVPLAGILSDRYGRIVVYRSFAIFQLLIAFPVWWILSLGNVTSSLIAMSIALAVGVWGMFGAQGALLPELFGARHRYIGVAAAREVSAVIAGGAAPLIGASIIAWTTSHFGGNKEAAILSWIPLAAYLTLLTVITMITTFYTPEPRGRDLDDLRDAGQSVGI
jgi:MHS family metabolite:H+ symporter-like MFS transporter